MDYKKFEKIKSDFNKLQDVEFISFSEDSVIIKNTVTQAIFQVPFTEGKEDKSLTFNFSEGIIVEKGQKSEKEKFEENVKSLNGSVKKIFNNFDEGVAEVKELIKTLPLVEEAEVLNPIAQATKNYVEVKGLAKAVSKSYRAYKESFLNFKESFNVFDESNQLKDIQVNFEKTVKDINESVKEYKEFSEALDKVVAFSNYMEDLVIDKDFAKAILESIDFQKDLKVTIPKALVMAQKSFNEELNIVDMSKNILDGYKQFFNEEDETEMVSFDKPFNKFGSSDAFDRPEFLQFGSGKYNLEDLAKLIKELEQSLVILPDLTSEDLMEITNMKSIIDYMYRTNTISDKKVTEVIDEFNKAYSGDSSDTYDDPLKDIGFKSNNVLKDQMSTGFALTDKHADIEPFDGGEEEVETPGEEDAGEVAVTDIEDREQG